MSLRLYRPDVECPRCGRRPVVRVTDALRQFVRFAPGDTVLQTLECHRRGCGGLYPLRVRHVKDAEDADGIPWIGSQPTAAPMVELTARQREVCVLVCEGVKDGRIAALLHLSFPAVRKHLVKASARMRLLDPALPRTSPRKTVQAYFRRQVQTGPVLDLFREEKAA